MPRALIVQGGWSGHHPETIGEIFAIWLRADGFDVIQKSNVEGLREVASWQPGDLIVPHWTMGEIDSDTCQIVLDAVARGVGIAGIHGGMGDAFRNNTEWQFMVGGQFVAHPGNDGTRYKVRMGPQPHDITHGLDDFEVASEQYYMHTDPGNVVIAECDFPNPSATGPHAGNPCRMPVAWVKSWGEGRVFYCSLGHDPSLLTGTTEQMIRRGFRWAARQPIGTGGDR